MWLLITVARSVTSKRLVAPIDGVLKEHGFVRKKMTLNRRSESLVDVVDLQVSKAGDAVTLNAGVVDREARRLLWGPETDQFLQVPECTVRSRPGELIDGRDVWWALDDEEAAEKIARTRVHRVLPFLERMHDPLAMEAQLAPHGAKQRQHECGLADAHGWFSTDTATAAISPSSLDFIPLIPMAPI